MILERLDELVKNTNYILREFDCSKKHSVSGQVIDDLEKIENTVMIMDITLSHLNDSIETLNR